MALDRFIIAPINSGVQTNLKPWLILDDSFENLENVYCFRGRVRKRFGSQYMGTGATTAQSQQLLSRFRIDLGPTVAGALAGTVPGGVFNVGQAFSIGSTIYYVFNPALGPQTMSDTGGTTITKTYDLSNGNFNFVGAPAGEVFFYPALPVMGLTQYQVGPINQQPSFGFDTRFAYTFTNGWSRSGSGAIPQWHGGNLNFFWPCNWEDVTLDSQLLFVTNFQVTNLNGLGTATDDPIWFYNGSTWQTLSYSPSAASNPGNIQPLTVTQTKQTATPGDTISNYVQSARIIVAFKNRLLLLNTIENNANGAGPGPGGITPANYLTSTNSNFVNRCRYSHIGSPLAANAWLESNFTYNPGTGTVVADGGGFIDAATDEQIISAEFIKDHLIVYFERSCWEIVWTGNEIFPFQFQKLNAELGSQSQFSTIPFDQEVLTVGQTGLHKCNGSNVSRFDQVIPDKVFDIADNNQQPQRIWGIRDYYNEMVFWNFPPDNENLSNPSVTYTYPNRVLAYNYQNGSFAFFGDCITAFGYFQQSSGRTWNQATLPWTQANYSWNSGVIAANFRAIIAGNMQGYVFLVNSDISRNAAVMQITNLVVNGDGTVTLTIIDHTLNIGEFISVENPSGITQPIRGIYKVISVQSSSVIIIQAPDIAGTYAGGGTSARVSNIQILTKQFNPYVSADRNVALQRVNFQVLKTAAGEVTVDTYTSYSNYSTLNSAEPGALVDSGVLTTAPYDPAFDPSEQQQPRLWHPKYFNVQGEAVQLNIYMSDDQMIDPNIAWADFELHAMVLYTTPTSSMLR